MTNTNSYTLGCLIRDLRLEQKLSQDLLCLGLCSKSKLSKIENGLLQPDIMLSEALLQRLGITDRIFTFWGNEKEARFHDLKFKVMHKHLLPKDLICTYLNEMAPLPERKDILYRQEYLFFKAIEHSSPEERIAELKKVLHLTLDNFDINNILSYRLTWCELTILNNLAHEYRFTNQTYLCSVYAAQIAAYMEAVNPDIILQANILPFTYLVHCRLLYLQKLYIQTVDYKDKINLSLMKYNIGAYGGYLFFYSQALGECKYLEKVQTHAINACAIDELRERFKNADVLRKYIRNDFGITLKY